jgi:UDP-N-acetylglucosamine diphosphorylase/glucosamine-1-phosphate N-acetyltransferase
MSLQIVVYEDNRFTDFFPLTCLRPVYTLRSGILPLFKRFERIIGVAPSSFICREQIAPLVASRYKNIPVNIIKKTDTDILFLNGRIRDIGDLKDKILSSSADSIFKSNGETVAVLFNKISLDDIPSVATFNDYYEYYMKRKLEFIDFDVNSTLYDYCWDIMSDIEKEISDDFDFLPTDMNGDDVIIDSKAVIINPDNVYFGNNVRISALSLIDASTGPVYVGDNTVIESFASIKGPCSIGSDSQILRGKISSSSIGDVCRIGGEVESTVFQSYVNKYHDGFIGHSYVGSWVNFGAMTTNSDLKNNYTNIRTRLNNKAVDTNSNKVGSFIGDHTKFGIGTLLNTGINIGLCCNLFGGALITDKEIKSFSWGQTGNYKNYDVLKAIETAKIVMNRREVELNEHEITVLKAYAEEIIESDGIINW